jgi:DNA-binding MarR family transcriptional regulator
MPRRRITIHLEQVLRSIAEHPSSTGYALAKLAGVNRHTVYRMLGRLVTDGWVESVPAADEPGRPDRNLITLTPLGRDKATEISGRAPYASQHVTRG